MKTLILILFMIAFLSCEKEEYRKYACVQDVLETTPSGDTLSYKSYPYNFTRPMPGCEVDAWIREHSYTAPRDGYYVVSKAHCGYVVCP